MADGSGSGEASVPSPPVPAEQPQRARLLDRFWASNHEGYHFLVRDIKHGLQATKMFGDFLGLAVDGCDAMATGSSDTSKLIEKASAHLGPMTPSWLTLKAAAEGEAKCAREHQEQLQSLAGRLHRQTDSLRERHKASVKEGIFSMSDCIEKFDAARHRVSELQSQYVARSNEAHAMTTHLATLEGAGRSKDAEKVEKTLRKTTAKAQQLEADYRTAVSTFATVRSEYEHQMTRTCKVIENTHRAHVGGSLNILRDFVKNRLELMSNSIETYQRALDALNAQSVESNLLFLVHHMPGDAELGTMEYVPWVADAPPAGAEGRESKPTDSPTAAKDHLEVQSSKLSVTDSGSEPDLTGQGEGVDGMGGTVHGRKSFMRRTVGKLRKIAKKKPFRREETIVSGDEMEEEEVEEPDYEVDEDGFRVVKDSGATSLDQSFAMAFGVSKGKKATGSDSDDSSEDDDEEDRRTNISFRIKDVSDATEPATTLSNEEMQASLASVGLSIPPSGRSTSSLSKDMTGGVGRASDLADAFNFDQQSSATSDTASYASFSGPHSGFGDTADDAFAQRAADAFAPQPSGGSSSHADDEGGQDPFAGPGKPTAPARTGPVVKGFGDGNDSFFGSSERASARSSFQVDEEYGTGNFAAPRPSTADFQDDAFVGSSTSEPAPSESSGGDDLDAAFGLPQQQPPAHRFANTHDSDSVSSTSDAPAAAATVAAPPPATADAFAVAKDAFSVGMGSDAFGGPVDAFDTSGPGGAETKARPVSVGFGDDNDDGFASSAAFTASAGPADSTPSAPPPAASADPSNPFAAQEQPERRNTNPFAADAAPPAVAPPRPPDAGFGDFFGSDTGGPVAAMPPPPMVQPPLPPPPTAAAPAVPLVGPPPAVAPPPPPPSMARSSEGSMEVDEEGVLPDGGAADDSIDLDTTMDHTLPVAAEEDEEEVDDVEAEGDGGAGSQDTSLSATFIESEAERTRREAELAEQEAQRALNAAARAEEEARLAQETAAQLQREIQEIESELGSGLEASPLDPEQPAESQAEAVAEMTRLDPARLSTPPKARLISSSSVDGGSEYGTPPSTPSVVRSETEQLSGMAEVAEEEAEEDTEELKITACIRERVNAKYTAALVSKCKVQIEGYVVVRFPAGCAETVRKARTLGIKVKGIAKQAEIQLLQPFVVPKNQSEFLFKTDQLADHLAKAPVEGDDIVVRIFEFKSNPGGAGNSPLRLRAFWKIGNKWLQLKLEYCFNTRLKQPLRDVAFRFKLDNVFNIQMKPEGKFEKGSGEGLWTLDTVSSNTPPEGLGHLHARFDVGGANQPKPMPISVQFESTGFVLSGLGVGSIPAREEEPVRLVVQRVEKHCAAGSYRVRPT